ncbi:hypothetical protein ACG873_11875 [Mesorhizobium sp. AaZ16]|uniref:hypothetical protein n=1 Tax=Mesorhizobium sp. AaZ16 TaxID=3402289 RepID=UPI00374F06CF
MQDWLDGLAGPGYTQAILWTFAALLLLVIVLVIVKLVRSLTFGTFVAGGRNRKTRLAVMDATAVDSHRRLVLVRRDDIEHLLLIGGPTDVVVERDIRLAQPRRPALTGDGGREAVAQSQQLPKRAPEPASPGRPATLPPRAPERPAPQPFRGLAPSAPAPQPPAKPEPPKMPPVASVPPLPQENRYAPAPRPQQPSFTPARPQPQPQPQQDDLDDALLKELEVSLDEKPERGAPRQNSTSLDDEMTKLLGELSAHKR